VYQYDCAQGQKQDNGREPLHESTPCSARRWWVGSRCHVF
jgi:hypothetical protein